MLHFLNWQNLQSELCRTEISVQKIPICEQFLLHKKVQRYCSQVGTFGTESAVRKRGGSRNLPYLNAKPRQIPLLGTYA